MKRISFLLVTLALCAAPAARAQDAATEERLNQLSGRIDNLTDAQAAIKSQLAALSREVRELREQVGKPTGNYAAQEDLKRLADAVKEIDRNRVHDIDLVRAELQKVAKSISAPPPTSRKATPSPGAETPSHPIPSTGFEYVIQKGDTLSVIVAAYREKNVKVTASQILNANPGLKAESLRVGQKIFIPAPQ
jgi:LysM repeat protein